METTAAAAATAAAAGAAAAAEEEEGAVLPNRGHAQYRPARRCISVDFVRTVELCDPK